MCHITKGGNIMALYKHTTSLQTKRSIRWLRDERNNKHEVHVTICGKETVFFFDNIGDANRQYEHLAAI